MATIDSATLNLLLAQAQQQESQANVAKKAAELNLKKQEMLLTDARERYRIETQNTVAVAGLQLKYGADMHKVQASVLIANPPNSEFLGKATPCSGNDVLACF